MKKKNFRLLILAGIFIMLASVSAFSQKGRVVEKNIEFARGSSSATVKGFITDRLDSHIFHLKAKAGQTMTVEMISPKPLRDAYLVVNFPLTSSGENEMVSKKRRYIITLPRDGDYEIYIEAIRDRIPYTIKVSIK